MIRKLLRRVFRRDAPSRHEPATISHSRHGIDRALVSSNARRVCETLQGAGHRAYIVGGAVRDLLVGRRPKDFDVATNPSPALEAIAVARGWRILRLFE